MKIAVVGGGPSGLFCATLVKTRRPDWSVTVLEQNRADATFGFGVVLADTGLARLRTAAPETLDRLMARMVFSDRQAIVHGTTPTLLHRTRSGGAVTRLDLLAILQEAALGAGVDVRFGVRIQHPDELAAHGLADADVVIGADGINSVIRGALEQDFGTTRSSLTNHFAWYGTDRVFEHSALVFRPLAGGAAVAHYYPYSATRSTFVAEIDDGAWHAMGLADMTDAGRQAFFEQLFAPELEGHGLISNNSNWRQFPVIRNQAWSSGRHVLVGDAHASAHFSIGSGTRIAMEDSLVLADSLVTEGEAQAGLARFAAVRGPEKAKLIGASERSYLWYENMARWLSRYTPKQFVYAFMMRTGRVDDARLAAEFPALYEALRDEIPAAQALIAGNEAS
jgi:2-polyprenyl-6-methoxyphenol hydroxylase-like FAD-dependent oxidoreductase